eukprot:CAMPEP_0196718204 /NCGR_PEP_ID=MMETSP1091-20130531/1479_1 /TAXON_ID=302021 /ORGANISM="Rhodomonas sp., Strain CCMP768" /LENGTH=298 /DNA_ID=CAMNT_0042058815 /DNA_START=22 /DNA_END=918 /DNA_ORIENTATION=-
MARQDQPVRVIAASLALIAVATLAVTALISQKQKADGLLQIIEVPMAPALFRMPGSGYSGRATNLEDYTDPYGGGDVPGPYGYVNDPYDGDWALGPLGGKAHTVQSLYSRPVVKQPGDKNLWSADSQGTNSIFMGKYTAKQAEMDKQQRAAPQRRAPPTKAQKEVAKHMQSDSFVPDADWVGTNSVFFGSNGGGNGWARKQKNKVQKRQNVMKAKTQSLFRSDDPHMAEYGFEGPNQLNDDVLPSAVGTGGPVIGVDGLPSNVDHTWVHYEEPFSFQCNPDILGCDTGLEVAPEYAWS